jgi:predicted esterase
MAHRPIDEQHLSIARTARYYTLGTGEASVQEVWFACHGYGQLARYFLRRFASLDDGTRLIVAPEALSRFYLENPGPSHANARVGATWMTREDRLSEIQDYVNYLDRLSERVLAPLDRAHTRVVLLGFSQGVATACRWAAFGKVAADALVLWAQGLPPDLDLGQAGERLRQLRLWLVAGEQDPALPAATLAAQHRQLEENGIPHEMVTFPGGHVVEGAVLADIARRLHGSGRGGTRPLV